MRKLFLLAALLSSVLMIGCSTTLESRLIGNWVLDNAEVINLDSVAKAQADFFSSDIQKSIEQVQIEIDSSKSESKRKELRIHKERFENELNNYTFVNIKTEYQELSKALQGNMTLQIESDNSLKCKVSYPENETRVGTWVIKDNAIATNFDNQQTDLLQIVELTGSKLIVVSPSQSQNGISMKLSFSKN